MRLYILRHGKAERDSPSGRDEDRPLADRGREQIRGLARLFSGGDAPARLRPPPVRVLSSPAVRADATARIIAEALSLEMNHEPALGLDAGYAALISLVERLAELGDSAMIVGHNPLLSRLVEQLARGDHLRTGELSVLDLEPTLEGREVARFREDE